MDKKPVIILGAGSIGKAALEIFKSHDVVVYCFLDDNESLTGTEVDEVSVLGKTDDDGFLKLIGKKCDAFIATDDVKYAKSLAGMLEERRKVMPINAVHATATVSPSAVLKYGTFINMGAKIATMAEIGNHCVIHAGAIIDSEAKLGDFVQVGAGSVISSQVTIENGAFIGSGVTIVSGVTIGKNARIGAGSVVIGSVKAGETVFGNPAKKVE
jgi:sugar O-acyltransferase (sialic acid O-acetyltransferase NeuD family)